MLILELPTRILDNFHFPEIKVVALRLHIGQLYYHNGSSLVILELSYKDSAQF